MTKTKQKSCGIAVLDNSEVNEIDWDILNVNDKSIVLQCDELKRENMVINLKHDDFERYLEKIGRIGVSYASDNDWDEQYIPYSSIKDDHTSLYEEIDKWWKSQGVSMNDLLIGGFLQNGGELTSDEIPLPNSPESDSSSSEDESRMTLKDYLSVPPPDSI